MPLNQQASRFIFAYLPASSHVEFHVILFLGILDFFISLYRLCLLVGVFRITRTSSDALGCVRPVDYSNLLQLYASVYTAAYLRFLLPTKSNRVAHSRPQFCLRFHRPYANRSQGLQQRH